LFAGIVDPHLFDADPNQPFQCDLDPDLDPAHHQMGANLQPLALSPSTATL
jgi:hypothetical protein